MPKWKPIEDLPADWEKIKSSHLAGLLTIWRERHEKMKDSTALREFNERLQREWSIETGIIEGLYTLDRGTTQLLIEHGLIEDYISRENTNRPVPQVIGLLRDHSAVLEGVFDFITQQRQLSTAYVKEVHAALTQQQGTVTGQDTLGRRFETELLRGEWKKLPNNPTRPNGQIHEYCPPEHTAAEMDRLLEMHRQHQEMGVPPEIESAWLHHRFTQIHPFQDGNGRVARILASLVFLRAGGFPLGVHRDKRSAYITALENADDGDLKPLVNLFVEIEEQAILQALNIAEKPKRVDEVLEAITERLKKKTEEEDLKDGKVIGLARRLIQETTNRLTSIAEEWEPKLKQVDSQITVRVELGNQYSVSDSDYTYDTLEEVLKKGYETNLRIMWHWIRLRYENLSDIADYIIVFHNYGSEFQGALAVLTFVKIARDRQLPDTITVTDKPLIFLAEEEEESLVERFSQWLDNEVIIGLEQWRRFL
jgi:Fic family protein